MLSHAVTKVTGFDGDTLIRARVIGACRREPITSVTAW